MTKLEKVATSHNCNFMGGLVFFVPLQEQFAENGNKIYHVCIVIVVLHIYHQISRTSCKKNLKFGPYQILSNIFGSCFLLFSVTISLIAPFESCQRACKFDLYHVSRVVRKPAFCICENKDANHLNGNREADQRLCFRYTDSTIPLLSKSKLLAIFCGCTAWFVSDLVENPEDRFSHNEAHVIRFL